MIFELNGFEIMHQFATEERLKSFSHFQLVRYSKNENLVYFQF